MNDYTVEVWKKDGRYKSGLKLEMKLEYPDTDYGWLEEHLKESKYGTTGYQYKIFETWVTRKCLLTGEPFTERYDTPYYCSPSSETYWSS